MPAAKPATTTIDHPTPDRTVELHEIDHAGRRTLRVGVVDSAEDDGHVYARYTDDNNSGRIVRAPYLASSLTEPSDDGRLAFSWRYPPRSDRKLEVGEDGKVIAPAIPT